MTEYCYKSSSENRMLILWKLRAINDIKNMEVMFLPLYEIYNDDFIIVQVDNV